MKTYEKVLFAADLKREDDLALTYRLEPMISTSKHYEVSLLHVIEPIFFFGSDSISSKIYELHLEAEEAARQKLATLGAHLRVPRSRQYVRIGFPKDIIVHIAKEIKADLIIIGHHHRKGIQGFFTNNTSQETLKHAPCDVLTVNLSLPIEVPTRQQHTTADKIHRDKMQINGIPCYP